MIPGVLIWWVPTSDIIAKYSELSVYSVKERNRIAEDMLGLQTLAMNSLIIFVDGMFYYIVKDELDGSTDKRGLWTELPALMKYYEEKYNV
jgi:hypothetical protein